MGDSILLLSDHTGCFVAVYDLADNDKNAIRICSYKNLFFIV